MSISIRSLRWKTSYLEVRYTSPDEDKIWLYRTKIRRFIPFEITHDNASDDPHAYVARLNIAIAQDREVLCRGDWILCRRIPDEDLTSLTILLEKHPLLENRILREAERAIPSADREILKSDPDPEVWENALHDQIEAEGVDRIAQSPYDTNRITYSDEIINNVENYDRIFPYGSGRYAYTLSFVARVNSVGTPFLILRSKFFVVNSTPKRRLHSKRQKQKDILSNVYSTLTKIVPRKKDRILFFKENGEHPTENMQALIDRMYERGMDKEFEIKQRYRNIFGSKQNPFHWLGDLWAIARARYIFVDDYTPVFNFIDPGEGVTLTQIWHAGVGFKSVGYARFGMKGSPDPYGSSHRRYTYALIGNQYLRDIYSEVFGIEKSALLATGMPRLDHFLDEDTNRAYTAEMQERYPWAKEGRVIVFAPTFRGTGQKQAHYPYERFFDMDKLYEMCVKTNSYFVFEMHHFIRKRPDIPEQYQDRIFDLSDESLNKLFFICDVLVTDYSSCFYDFILLKKPVIFYTPDKQQYSLTRGVQRPVDEMAPGRVCDTFEEFMDVLENNSYELVEPLPASVDRAAERSGLASDRAIDVIIYGKDLPDVKIAADDTSVNIIEKRIYTNK